MVILVAANLSKQKIVAVVSYLTTTRRWPPIFFLVVAPEKNIVQDSIKKHITIFIFHLDSIKLYQYWSYAHLRDVAKTPLHEFYSSQLLVKPRRYDVDHSFISEAGME